MRLDMSKEDYDRLPGLRATHLKAGRDGMDVMHATITGEIDKSSKAMSMGDLVHIAVLEPDRFDTGQ